MSLVVPSYKQKDKHGYYHKRKKPDIHHMIVFSKLTEFLVIRIAKTEEQHLKYSSGYNGDPHLAVGFIVDRCVYKVLVFV